MPPANVLPIERPIPGTLQQLSTRMAFFVAGLGMAAWAPLVPLAKARLGADEGTLGALLLCLGMGSIIPMPLTGTLAARHGCRLVIWIAGLIIASCLPLLATISSPMAFAATLLVFGASVGTVDVAVNIQAVIVERASGRSMMSGFHGFYSVAGIVGAGLVTALFGANVSPLATGLVVSGIIVALLLVLGRHLLPYGSEEGAASFVFPRGKVLLIGLLCFTLFLAEGSVLDWSGVFLTSVRHVEEAWAGLGYVAFAATMTLGRLTGDRIVAALGVRRILQIGGLLSAAGFLLAILVPSSIAGVIGFGLVGAGASNVVPVLFTAAGRQTAMPTNLAISAITTLGYTGILAGPAVIGFVARHVGLSLALGIVALLLVGVTLSAKAASE